MSSPPLANGRGTKPSEKENIAVREGGASEGEGPEKENTAYVTETAACVEFDGNMLLATWTCGRSSSRPFVSRQPQCDIGRRSRHCVIADRNRCGLPGGAPCAECGIESHQFCCLLRTTVDSAGRAHSRERVGAEPTMHCALHPTALLPFRSARAAAQHRIDSSLGR